jgi:hypothetical protein
MPETPESLVLEGITAGLDAGRFIDEDDLDGADPGASDDSDELDADTQDGDDEPDELDDEEGDLDADDAPDDRTAPEQSTAKKPATKPSPAEWGRIVAADAARVAEVSNKALRDPAFLQALREESARLAGTTVRQQLTEQLRTQENYRRFVFEVESHFDGDPDGLLAWIQTDPQGPVYTQAKQLAAAFEQQTPDERVAAADGLIQLNQRSVRQFERLSRFPELQAEIARRQEQEQRYPASEEGLAALERDVDELLERGFTQRSGGDGGNGEQRTAPPGRPRAARPMIGGGQAAPRGQRSRERDISKIDDPTELFSSGIGDGIRRQRSGGRAARR